MAPNCYYGLMLKIGAKYGYFHHFEDFFLREVISTSGAYFDHCARVWGLFLVVPGMFWYPFGTILHDFIGLKRAKILTRHLPPPPREPIRLLRKCLLLALIPSNNSYHILPNKLLKLQVFVIPLF